MSVRLPIRPSLLLCLLAMVFGFLGLFVSKGAPGDVDFRFDPGGASTANADTVPLADGSVFSNGELFVGNVRDFSFQNTNFIGSGLTVQRFRTGLIVFGPDIRYFANVRQSNPTWVAKVGTNQRIQQVAISPGEERIFLFGPFTQLNGLDRPGLACLLSDGSVDLTFQPEATPNMARVRDMSVEASGDLLVAGDSTPSSERRSVVRVGQLGKFDLSFNPCTNLFGGDPLIINSIVAQPDGKILLSGNFTNFNGYSTSLARIRKDGTKDSDFQPQVPPGIWSDSQLRIIRLLSDGRFYVSANLRFMPNGSKDPTYNPPSVVTDVPVRFEVAPDSTVYVSRVSRVGNESPNHGVVHLLANGAYDRDFGRAGPSQTVTKIFALPDGKSLIWSERSPWITRLNSDGSIDQSFAHPNVSEITAVAISGTAIYLADYFISSSYGATRVLRLNPSGLVEFQSPLFTTDYNYPLQITTLVPCLDGGCVVSGSFRFANGQPASNLVRLQANGSLDSSFSTDQIHDAWAAGGTFYTAATLPNGQFYLGTLASIRRVNANGSIDSTFQSQQGFATKQTLSSFIRSVLPLTDGSVLVAGFFTEFGSVNSTTPVGKIVRLKNDGVLDQSFRCPDNLSDVSSISMQSDGKIIVASDLGVQRLNPDGSIDSSFRQTQLLPKPACCSYSLDYYPFKNARSVAVDLWDDILVAGEFTSVNGLAIDRVTRLLGGGGTTPVRFNQINLTETGLHIGFSGPTNYFTILESGNGTQWFPTETNALLFGKGEATRRTSKTNEFFRLRLTRP